MQSFSDDSGLDIEELEFEEAENLLDSDIHGWRIKRGIQHLNFELSSHEPEELHMLGEYDFISYVHQLFDLSRVLIIQKDL